MKATILQTLNQRLENLVKLEFPLTNNAWFDEYLYELQLDSVQFAKKHPLAASELNLTSFAEKDKTINLLFQAMAYLLAANKERQISSEQTLAKAFIKKVFGDLLLPLPSIFIGEVLNSDNTQIKQIPINSKLKLQDGVYYTNPQAITITPNKILSVETKSFSANKHALEINILQSRVDKSYNFYFDFLTCDPILAVSKLLHNSEDVILNDKISLGVDSLEYLYSYPCFLTTLKSKNYLPYKIVDEFFAYPERIKFLKLNLNKVKCDDKLLKISIIYRGDKINLKPGLDSIKLNAGIWLNIFEYNAYPIKLNKYKQNYKLVADYNNKNIYIYDLSAITSNENIALNYNFQDNIISLTTAYEDLILSPNILAHNNNYPQAKFIEKSISVTLPSNPDLLITNISRPTACLHMSDNDKYEELLEQYDNNYTFLLDLKALQKLLTRANRRHLSLFQYIINKFKSLEYSVKNIIYNGFNSQLLIITLSFEALDDFDKLNANPVFLCIYSFYENIIAINMFLKLIVNFSDKSEQWQKSNLR